MPRHPDKHIRAAIEEALALGWRLKKSSPRAHAWGYLLCPERSRDGHRVRVASTPRSAERDARRIRDAVEACKHNVS